MMSRMRASHELISQYSADKQDVVSMKNSLAMYINL